MALDGVGRARRPRGLRLLGDGPLIVEHGPSWLLFLGLTLAAGGLVGRFRLLPAVGDPRVLGALRRRLLVYGRIGGGIAVLAMAAVLWRQVVEFRDPFVPLADDLSLLLTTDWGTAWKWGSMAAALGFLGFLLAGLRGVPGSLGWGAAALGIAALGVFPAFTGHASNGDPLAVTRAADVLHVWTSAVWIGGLGALLLALRRTAPEVPHPSPELVHAFSPVALVAVAVLIPTGLWASNQHLGSPADLVSTPWGRLLGIKLILVAIVLALGARNWKRLTPALGSSEGDSAMRRSAAAELLFGHLALLVTAVLIRTSPP